MNEKIGFNHEKHRLAELEEQQSDAAKNLRVILEANDWIQQERELFGKENSEYDFSNHSVQAARQELHQREAESLNLREKINRKATNMYEKVAEQYKVLERKKNVVRADKKKIESVIQQLDEEKRGTIKRAWDKVNEDFGSIFNTLLPGSSAKLIEKEGTSFMEGLHISIAFGNVWKDSLSELSGGQKSILALSLILALVGFKPAPLYILDEVDAALDLHHTQNIGRMIKTHFPWSQFIIVSHKPGMFDKANVLFHVEFVNGISTITRSGQ